MKPKYIPLVFVGLLAAWFAWQGGRPTSPISGRHAGGLSDNNSDKPQGVKEALLHLQQVRANQNTGMVDVRDVMAARKQADNAALAKTLCDPAPSVQVEWEELGPNNVGGRTRALVIDKGNAGKLYSGGVTGGFWISDDAGANWRISGGESMHNLSVGAIAQSSNGSLFVGTGEGFVDGRAAGDGKSFSGVPGGGIYRSTDGGETLELIPSTIPQANSSDPYLVDWSFIIGMAADPNNAGKLYAATQRGVWVTYNADAASVDDIEWQRPAGITSTAYGYEVKFSPDGSKLYVLVGSGIYVSENGGAFENRAGDGGLPFSDNRRRLAVSPTNPEVAYLVTTSGGCIGAVYQTTDGGNSWGEIGVGDFLLNPCADYCQCWYDLAMAVDPANENRLFLGGVVLYSWSSTDGWQQINANFGSEANPYYIHSDIHEIVFDGQNDGIAYIATDGGIFKSTNADELYPTFESANKYYNVTQFYSVAASLDGQVIGGTQDNGSPYLGYNYNSVGSTLSVMGGDGGYTEISHIKGNAFFAESQNGSIRRSSNGGQGFSTFLNEEVDADTDGNLDSGPFLTAFFLWENVDDYYNGSGEINAKFFTGGNNRKLWVTNEALVFSTIPDFEQLGTFALGALSSMAFSLDGQTIYAMSNRGSIIRIFNIDSDFPATASISSPLFNARYCTGIAMDVYNPETLVVSAGNYGNDNYVFMAENGTSPSPTFTSIQYNLPAMPVYDVVINPDQPEHYVIAATEMGIWTYNLFTQCWSEQNGGLGRVPVFRLRLQDYKWVGCKVLYIGTHGRGFFRSTSLTSNFCDTTLPDFDPGLDTGVDGTGMTAKNGRLKVYPNPMTHRATLDFELAENAGEAVLHLYDLQGKLVRQTSLGALVQGRHKLDFERADLAAGSYLVNIATRKEKLVGRVVVVQ